MIKYLLTTTIALVTVWMPSTSRMNGYAFPLRADGLAGDERYYTVVHQSGVQGLGNDIIAKRYTGGVSWSDFKPTNNKPEENESRVVYGKAFYAMEDGVVVGCWRNAPNNVPGSVHRYLTARRYAGGGNHLWILQKDSAYALYAHAIPGSIPSGLCPHSDTVFATTADATSHSPDIDSHVKVVNGASVKKGQFLGNVGNSGASAQFPHIHVHMEKDGKPWPMKFERGMTAIYNNVTPRGPWTRLAGNELPKEQILVWAPHTVVSKLSWDGVKAPDYQLLFDHFEDSGFLMNRHVRRRQQRRDLSRRLDPRDRQLAQLGRHDRRGLQSEEGQRAAARLPSNFQLHVRHSCGESHGRRVPQVGRKQRSG